jgi:hypothetical protein
MPAIVMRNLCFDFGPTKLVVFRVDHQDLPHLTFSWKNQSGEVDIHLTPRSPRDANDRESILRIRESDLKDRVGDLGRRFWNLARKKPIQMVWCVSPKWLAARGYVLVGSSDERVSLWLQKALPKKRGKYRLDERVLKRSPKSAFYPPTARNFARVQEHGQIWTVCKKGPCRGTILFLLRLDASSKNPFWLGIEHSGLSTLLSPATRLLAQWFTSLAPGAWNTIYGVLRLKEIGF